MPQLISNEQIVEDQWLSVDAEATPASSGQILNLSQWQALTDKTGSAVQLEPGDGAAPLLDELADIALIAINFPVFTDGRGFSYARELRERGYTGELRAVGHFIRDQLHFLKRCGFNAFQLDQPLQLEDALASLADFSEHYQPSIDRELPLFRRR